MKINRFIKILCFGVLLIFVAALIFIIAAAFCAPKLNKTAAVGQIAFSKENTVIAYTPAPDTRYRFKADSDEVDPLYLKMLIAAEDERFYYHLGVDPIAICRALFSNLLQQKRVSGASTLAMQVIRLNNPALRTYTNKLKEALHAVHLTLFQGRKNVLDNYLTTAPFGSGIEGITAAALFWFGHLPDHLTPAEAALLVALPRSPEKIRPDLFPQKAKHYRDLVLFKAYTDGIIKKDVYLTAINEPVPRKFAYTLQKGFHFGNTLFKQYPSQKVFYTTISDPLQNEIINLVHSFKESALSDEEDIAIIVIDNADHSVCAYVGSKDYRKMELDLVQAIRSPGSALKPFAYAIAFAENKLHPKTVLSDTPHHYGTYSPKNFLREFKGEVPADYALYSSLNLPALTVFQSIGPDKFIATLNKNKNNIILPKGSEPGLAIILGGCGISLYNLTSLYAALFNDGMFYEPCTLQFQKPNSFRFLNRSSSRAVFNILKNTAVPQNFLKNTAISYKTGTSYDFIDALAVGSNGRFTAGIWIGKPDGSSNYPQTGYTRAAPLLYSLLNSFPQDTLPRKILPQSGALSALPPPFLKDLTDKPAPVATNNPLARRPLKIVFPENNSIIKTKDDDSVSVVIEGGAPPYTLYVDGIEQHSFNSFSAPAGGFYELCVIDTAGNEKTISVQIF